MILNKVLELGAAFFDIFGIFVFVFIVATALFALKHKRRLPDWILLTYILILDPKRYKLNALKLFSY